MGQRLTADHIRELLVLAKQMRAAASDTKDPNYIDMFLRAALGLEEKATKIAQESPEMADLESEILLRGPINLTC
jgi:hypothetical protein